MVDGAIDAGDAVDRVDDYLTRARERWDRELGEVADALLEPLYEAAGDAAVRAIMAAAGRREVKDVSPAFRGAFDVTDPGVLTALANRRRLIVGANGTTATDIRGAVARGASKGESVPEIGRRVRDQFEHATTNRARMIARTETAYGTGAASVAGARQTGVVGEKVWIAAADERTRDSHADADGQTVALDDPFEVGGYAAEHPVADTLPAEESVNCRCTVAFELAEPTVEPPEQEYRSWDSESAADDALVAEYEGWAETLPPDEAGAVFNYTLSAYSPINRALRAGQTPPADLGADLIAAALARQPLSQGTIAYRGLRASELTTRFDNGTLVGTTFRDRGFMSTTLSRQTASDFSSGSGVLVELRVPAGTRAAYVRTVSAFGQSEMELLVTRGAELRFVEAYTAAHGQRTVVAEVVRTGG